MNKLRYDKLKENGICVSCGTRDSQDTLKCTRCRDLDNKRSKDYWVLNKERLVQKSKKRNTARKNHLLKKYGITLETFNFLEKNQQELCAICNRPNNLDRSLYPDHDHRTNQLRKLLCQKCNSTLGFVNDSKELLLKTVDYLNEFTPEIFEGAWS